MSQRLTAADGHLGDWLQHKPKCGCTDCQLERSEARERELEKRSRQLYEALVALSNEAFGFVSMADINTHGYTNIRVLHDKIHEAREAIRVYERRGTTGDEAVANGESQCHHQS